MFWSQKFPENITIFVACNKDGKHVVNKDDLDDELKPNFFTTYKVFHDIKSHFDSTNFYVFTNGQERNM